MMFTCVSGQVAYMNQENFEKDTWMLHRKLFHRFMKYSKYFRQATEALPEFQQAIQDEDVTVLKKQHKTEEEVPKPLNIISLLTSSSDEVSEDEQEEEEEKGRKRSCPASTSAT